MNLISDYEAHKRDEAFVHPKYNCCPIHGVPLILARGYTKDGVTHTEVFEAPKCSECMRLELRRLNDLESQCGVNEQ